MNNYSVTQKERQHVDDGVLVAKFQVFIHTIPESILFLKHVAYIACMYSEIIPAGTGVMRPDPKHHHQRTMVILGAKRYISNVLGLSQTRVGLGSFNE